MEIVCWAGATPGMTASSKTRASVKESLSNDKRTSDTQAGDREGDSPRDAVEEPPWARPETRARPRPLNGERARHDTEQLGRSLVISGLGWEGE